MEKGKKMPDAILYETYLRNMVDKSEGDHVSIPKNIALGIADWTEINRNRIEVRHGRWAHKEAYKDAGFGFYKCTECGEPFWFNNMNYCPNCGAKMDEVENG